MRLRTALAAGIVVAFALCVYKFWPSDSRTHGKAVPKALKTYHSSGTDDGNRYLRMMENVPDNALKDLFVVLADDDGDLDAFLDAAQAAELDVRKPVRELGIALVCVSDEATRKKLVECLPDRASLEYDYVAVSPDIADAHYFSGAEALDTSVSTATGCPDDPSWGRGVSFALLDMKLMAHPSLALKSVIQFDDSELQNKSAWHATAMASIVGGSAENLSGIARGAKILNFVVIGGDVFGDSYDIAKAIADAVLGGASVICPQSATEGDSRAIALAVHFAKDKNALVVAPSGCSGKKLYPADTDDVFSVGAIDGAGNIVGNVEEVSDIYAPGVGVPVAGGGGNIVPASGCGVAATIVAGAISGLIYENPGMSTYTAAELLREYADRSGLYAESEEVCVIDVDRVRNRTVQGLRDIAVTGVDVQPNATGGRSVRVAVRNRGTATTGFSLEVTDGVKAFRFANQGLSANQFQIFSMDFPPSDGEISASVRTMGEDDRPDNNVW